MTPNVLYILLPHWINKEWHGDVVARTVASKQESSGSNSDADHSVWSLHVISVPAWVLFSFLTQSKGMHVRLATLD